ncbi:MAG TPA: hypothetical protein VEB22_05960 [Phycisphaerales bacterium]|nr:hypothetical protein [Phycisphaerales bacterium]
MKLFQYAVIYHPTGDEKKAGKKSEIVVPVTECVAADEKTAGIIAGRAIPEKHLADLDRLEVAVRPF